MSRFTIDTETQRRNRGLDFIVRRFQTVLLLSISVLSRLAVAAEHHGKVMFGGFPVPGATITASRDGKALTVTTDMSGRYSFPDLADGTWKLHVDMQLFEPQDRDISVAAAETTETFELKLLPQDAILSQAQPTTVQTAEIPSQPSKQPEPAKETSEGSPSRSADDANDGLLINGSSNNAATSKYSLAQAFGNQRSGSTALYTGGIGMHFGNSVLDARPYSITGLDTPKPSYNRFTALATLAGPLRIPHILPRGPNFNLLYEWARDSTAQALSGLVPTAAQRAPNFTVDPTAAALLSLYPLPNLSGNASYNYQVPVLNREHADVLQLRLDKGVGRRDTLNGSLSTQSTREDGTNLFGFLDRTKTLGINAKVNWEHRLGPGLYFTLGYSLSRLRTDVTPQFENRVNISGNAGMTGNLQDSRNWGPPTLAFSSGIATLTDVQSAFNRNLTQGVSYGVQWNRRGHNVQAGGDFRRQEFNYLQQADPRGTFTFTGAAFGDDLTDFLRGVPDTASIAYGNADKYLRQSVYDLYANDNWHVRPDLTINYGLRWEYGAPLYELKNRLVNLDVAGDFMAVSQTLASNPVGARTGQQYPRSLIRPDRNNVQPRVAVSWRPIPASSMVVRAGYGIYNDTSVYQTTTFKLAQQAPLSRTVTANNADCAQSLRNGPVVCGTSTANTFATDPNFQVGYAQVWQLSVQRDLPWALQMTATYSGVKGSDGVQQFLPNTYAPGAQNPCLSCPVGFLYQTSGGSSIRHAGILQVRRRLRSGFTATALYTYAKSIDNDAMLGGQGPPPASSATALSASAPQVASTIAQNWRNLNAERSRSSFDQRHLLNLSLQYTTGMGLHGGTLLQGWRGRVYKEWSITAVTVAGTGKPLTPVYLTALNGTGYIGLIRPDVTGVSVYDRPTGRFLNPAAYTAPQTGEFGNAGRYSITGPNEITLDTSLSRTFRLDKRLNLDVRVDATNTLNHVVFAAYDTTVNPSLVSPTFGLPTSADEMRQLQITGRLRF